ncbi:MAG: DUF192 domain-containing protein [Rhodocyclaceae bacterium]|nr:DUF192 domain-containing protein [Rhodocyclaceae bacterium]
MKQLVLAALLLGGVVAASAQSLPVMELTAGFHRIEAEVAANNPDRMQGLMQRQAMPQHRGMLFVFAQEAQHCMWMKNTFLPLSVAFLDETGRILNIEEMKPQNEDNHCAAKPARYALEMNAGWFARRGIKRGDVIGGIERAPRAF